MPGGRFVHRDDAERLQTTGTVQRLDDAPGAFIGRLIAIAPQAGDMQQHVRHAIVGDDEAEALAGIEPLDGAGNLDGVEAVRAVGRMMALRRPGLIRRLRGLPAVTAELGPHTQTPLNHPAISGGTPTDRALWPIQAELLRLCLELSVPPRLARQAAIQPQEDKQ